MQLTAARDGFLAEGIPYDTALVSLELAHLYAEQGRTEDLKRISAEMLPIFASRNITARRSWRWRSSRRPWKPRR